MAMLGKRRPNRRRSGVSGLQRQATPPPVVGEDATAPVIERLAHDGRGVAHAADGKTLFVAGALPGERVEAAVHRARKRYDEGHVRTVLEASPQRVAPPCAHYARCGGCDLQHLSLTGQRTHKQAVLVDLLAREGIELAEPPLLLAEPDTAYRRRARLGVKVDGEGRLHLGFRERHANRLVDIGACPVLVPRLAALLGPLRQSLERLEAPRCVGHVELLDSDGGAAVVVRQLRESPADRERWQAFGEAHGVAVGHWLGRESPEFAWLTPPPSLHYVLPGGPGDAPLRLRFAPGDFVQVNAAVNRRLVATVRDWLAVPAGRTVLDLYAGIGNFSLPLAADGARVTAIEGHPAMVSRLADNARDNALTLTAEQADLGDIAAVSALLETHAPRAVLLDPPREGAEAVCRALTARPVPVVAYIACDPATLARDAARLVHGGYRIARAAVADMFVHTSHLESVLLFEHPERQPLSQGT
ncbi:TRAM domain-containing protein [Billgrantia gudaonensis]|uniref:23S rRNA (uracil(1939)-C(5))-methyltransferase RlmD n=1 Tax=Billgrantia gudaonensis TaxID=376427 RepID=A0A1G8NFN9_9GAMM|nr:TRAM domain-containing protein [Halomonas gudaonensis]SDI79081.1 23S rRNA (uracil1939-C5)-methyltransferase [Halomonas gudaonensis]